uniref:Uncharacterized protein n=1 Tax=Rhizophora mucronata TaxID=61149 RepID=A0A2P2NHR1_RHIMU
MWIVLPVQETPAKPHIRVCVCVCVREREKYFSLN